MGRASLTEQVAARQVAALLGAVVAFGVLTGCGTASGATGGPATVEELATKTGCAKPQIQVDAEELRQAVCKTPVGQYSVTTFATEEGKKQWLAGALDYGGWYLIGTRWIILGNTEEMLEPFLDKVGGSLKMGGHLMPSGTPMPGHSMSPGQTMSHDGHTMPTP